MAKTTAKQKKKPATPASVESPRRLKTPAYSSFRLQKRIKGDKLPSAFKLLGTSLLIARRNWKVFLGIIMIYGLLSVFLVQSVNAVGDIRDAKDTLQEAFTGSWSELTASFTVFTYLLGSPANSTNPTAGVYQIILALTISLAVIWALRQMHAGNKIRVRDAFYNGMAPLVPFILVLLVVALQLVPMAAGLALQGVVTKSGIAVTGTEQIVWGALAFILSVLSLYMVSSSIFALYIVTLPGTTPLQALRSARQLVTNRRWAVIRKIIFLPIVLLLFAAVILVPVIMFITPASALVFFVLSMMLIPAVHSYMYALYRSMI